MSTLWNVWKIIRSIKKTDLWPLVLELIQAAVYWFKHRHEPGALQRLFTAIMAVVTYLLVTNFTPDTVRPLARQGGREVSAILLRIPGGQRIEDWGEELVVAANQEFWAGANEDDPRAA